ncbi:ATP-binding cassette domain-containing protein [uncultured Cohaesibacter sp.]|uniref:ABC transporter ATP-binding protein n=1 Tax=uncultured Cohaesibacter sp. TaxID=1002546 RepID=UPI00292F9ACC|nr:ATP-binding cassette domain-containing protein [uncultured Cohaesibacter sp.]
MIEVSNLCLHFSNQRILHNISFSLKKGETLAIIGESGGGKTSLARLLLRLFDGKPIGVKEQVFSNRPKGFYWSGSARIDGLDILHAKPGEIRQIRGQKVGLIAQALSDALNPHLTIAQHIEEILNDGSFEDQTVEEIFCRYNIPAQLHDQYPSRLSGGEIQRVLSALALAKQPDYLILDEPTASLDPENREIAIQGFSSGSRRRGQILITHDLALAQRLADRVAVLYKGEVIEEGDTEKIFQCPKKTYTGSLIQVCHQHPRCKADENAANGSTCPVCKKTARTTRSEPTRQGLFISHVFHRYGSHFVLNDVSTLVPKGSCLGLVGPSGCGKSTLARLLVGLEPVQQGAIFWDEGRDATSPARTRSALVSQHPHRAMAHHFSVSDVLQEALKLEGKRNKKADRTDHHSIANHVRKLLQQVGLPQEPDFLSRKTAALSGGEAQRLVIARALATRPSYLVLDEPTSALDMCARSQILSLLADLISRQSLTTVIFTHDHDAAHFLADQILTIVNGRPERVTMR